MAKLTNPDRGNNNTGQIDPRFVGGQQTQRPQGQSTQPQSTPGNPLLPGSAASAASQGISLQGNSTQQIIEQSLETVNPEVISNVIETITEVVADVSDLQNVTVTAPIPPAGYNKAKIIIRNSAGEESEEEIEYIYKDICLVPIVPVYDFISETTSEDLVDAYDDCIDAIADLYCEPVSGQITPNDPRIKSVTIIGSEPYTINSQITIRIEVGDGAHYLLIEEPYYELRTSSSFTHNVTYSTGGTVGQQNIAINLYRPDGSTKIDTTTLQIQIEQRSTGDTTSISITGSAASARSMNDNDISDGKKITYVLSSSVTNQVRDSIRTETNSIWKIQDDIISFAPNLSEKPYTSIESTFNWRTGLNTPSYFYENFEPPELLNSFNSEILDIVYDIQKPYTPKEYSKTENPFNSLILDVNPTYNFYNKQYEEVHYDQPEYILPNMYYLQLHNNALKQQAEAESIDPDIIELLSIRSGSTTFNVGEKEYYRFYSENINSSDLLTSNITINYSKNIVIPYNFLDKLEQYNKNKNIFPFYVDIKFGTSASKHIGTLMKETQFGEIAFLKILNNFANNNTQINQFFKQQYEQDEANLFISNNKTMNLNFQDLTGSSVPNESYIYLGDYKLKNDASNGQALLGDQGQFDEIFQQILKYYSRTYDDIVNGKKCYSETLFYRISKRKAGAQEDIQNIWIPNDPSKNYLRYIDTQVKYSEEYTYTIYSYDLVIGNKYRKSANQISLYNELPMYVIENVYDQFDTAVYDSPPTQPEVFVYPFNRTDDMIAFSLNKNGGRVKQQEVALFTQDQQIFNNIRRYQNLDPDEMIEFGGDDIIKKYEIFRMEEKPESYEDFAENLLTEVDTVIDTTDPRSRVSSTLYYDNIESNKKYYYMFRAIDIHDNVSNPSKMFQVEIINEHGTVYPLISEYKFEEKSKQITKSFKRFILIEPEFEQQLLNIDTQDVQNIQQLEQKIHLGTPNLDSMIDKRYKIRVRSKQTNKIYDINFSFGLNKEIIE